MHIWTLDNWRKYYNPNDHNYRTGVRIRFDKNVDTKVRRACKEFMRWLRNQYFFPIRLPIYIKSAETIKTMDGDNVSAVCFIPDSRYVEPYIRVAVGDYYEMLENRGKDNALAAILRSIAHELTHYFQWINDIELTKIGLERQATMYARFILDEYAQTREHP